MTYFTRFIVAILLISITSHAPAQETDQLEKTRLINALLETTGVSKITAQIIDAQIEKDKRLNPEVPISFWNEERAIRLKEQTDAVTALYSKYFSVADLEATVAFYRTPAGQKYIQVLPALTQEMIPLAQEVGRKDAVRVNTKIRARDYTH